MKLAARGVNIILTYNSQQQEALNVVREIELIGVKAVAIQLNVAESAGFATFAAQVKQQLHDVWQRDSFDYLLNNAGTGLDALFEKQQSNSLMI